MNTLKIMIKGAVAGIGAIAPGLSGSVLLVLLGLYERTIQIVSAPFKNFKENMRFLIPLGLGLVCGVLIFSKLVDYLLTEQELYTRYAFLGLVLGTIPLFYKQVRKKGMSQKYYLVIVGAAIAGFVLFNIGGGIFPEITNPNFFQSMLLGVMVAASSIVPGIDSAVILSALGMYRLYVSSLADMNIQILIPAAMGLLAGVVVISVIMNWLLKKAYTTTFAVVFGMFLSIVPKIITENCYIASVGQGVLAISFAILGCATSFYLSDVRKNTAAIKRIVGKMKRKKQ